MNTFEYTLSDGTVIKLRKLKMKDLLDAENTNSTTMRAMKLIAAAVVEVDGEEKKLTVKDILDWDIGDFQKVSDQLSKFSGIELTEGEVKKEY